MKKINYKYGYLEIRAKFPDGNKVWPAFWTIASSRVWCPEFDIAEYFGKHGGMGEHLCYDEWPKQKWDSYFEHDIDDVHDWHTYGLNWQEGKADFYIDRKLNRSISAEYVPDEAMYIVLNNGVQKTDQEDTGIYPNALEVDYIRLYANESSEITELLTQ